MNPQSHQFIELSNEFTQSLTPQQTEQFRRLLDLLRQDTQTLMATLSAGMGDSYRLLDQLLIASPASNS